MSPRTEASIHPSNSGENMYPSISENDNMYPSIPEKDYMYPSIPENDCFSSSELKFIDSTLVRVDGEAKVPLGTAHSGQSRVREETGNFSCVQEKRRDASRVSRSSRSYPTDCVVKSSTTASGHVRLRLKNSSKRRPMLPKSEVVKNNLMIKVPGILEGTVFWKKNRIQFKDSGDVKGIWFGVEETQEAALLVTAMQDKAVTASNCPRLLWIALLNRIHILELKKQFKQKLFHYHLQQRLSYSWRKKSSTLQWILSSRMENLPRLAEKCC